MSFKDFMYEKVFLAPATVLKLLSGYTSRSNEYQYSFSDAESSLKPKNRVADFFHTHGVAISITFWVVLGLALAAATGGVVMAVFFPAALATLAGVSVFGLSLASIAGASAAAQVALFAGLVVAATSVTGLVTGLVTAAFAAFVALGKAVVSKFRPNEDYKIVATENPSTSEDESVDSNDTSKTTFLSLPNENYSSVLQNTSNKVPTVEVNSNEEESEQVSAPSSGL